MQKWLLIFGGICFVLALLWPWIAKLGLGRLPGDILFRRGDTTFYFPIVTCIVVSVVVSLILWFFRR